MNGFFTTREVALAVWLLVLVAFAATSAGVRRPLLGVVRVALHWKLVAAVLLTAAYSALVVGALYAIGLWTPNLLKDTIFWFLFAGLPLVFAGVQLGNHIGTWRQALKEQVKIIVLVEYLVNTYTFTLVVELVLVPVLATIALLDAMARADAKHAGVARLTGWLQGLIGLVIITSAVRQAGSHAGTFEADEALRAIVLVPILSLLVLPVVYLLALLSAYEQLFLRLRIGQRKDRTVLRYAKRRLIRHLGWRLHRVVDFNGAHAADLMRVTNNADVDSLLEQHRSGAPHE